MNCRVVFCAIAFALLWPVDGTASYIGGTYEIVASNNLGLGYNFAALIPNAPTVAFETEHYHHSSTRFVGIASSGPYTADSYLSVDLSPGKYHAYADTAGSITDYDGGVDPGAFVRGYAALFITALDVFHFDSSILPAGSDVSFELTATLHSTIAFGSTAGGCSPASPSYASMLLEQVGGGNLFPGTPLYHDSCGSGADTITATRVLHSTVGGVGFGLTTYFRINADAQLSGGGLQAAGVRTGSVHSVVDASSTGKVYVRVLTPDVTFRADSGASYRADVPEPGTFLLIGFVIAAAVASRRGMGVPRRG